jgi:hypothetical protein
MIEFRNPPIYKIGDRFTENTSGSGHVLELSDIKYSYNLDKYFYVISGIGEFSKEYMLSHFQLVDDRNFEDK